MTIGKLYEIARVENRNDRSYMCAMGYEVELIKKLEDKILFIDTEETLKQLLEKINGRDSSR